MTSEEILSGLRKIIRALNLESKRIQKEFGISIPQLLCLQYLKKAEKYCATSKEVAQALNLNPSTITGIISRLEKKGLVARLPNQGDKRVVLVSLTTSGLALLDSAPKLFHQTLDERLATLSQADLDTVKRSLDLLTRLLDVSDLDAAPLLTITNKMDEDAP